MVASEGTKHGGRALAVFVPTRNSEADGEISEIMKGGNSSMKAIQPFYSFWKSLFIVMLRMVLAAAQEPIPPWGSCVIITFAGATNWTFVWSEAKRQGCSRESGYLTYMESSLLFIVSISNASASKWPPSHVMVSA